MTQMSINLPEAVRDKLEQMALRSGHRNVEQFVEQVLEAEAQEPAEDYAAPSHLSFHTQADLGTMLLKRLEDPRPSIEATPEFWKALNRKALGQEVE